MIKSWATDWRVTRVAVTRWYGKGTHALALTIVAALTGAICTSMAHAQIAFRAASSSTALSPQYRSSTSATLPVPAFRAAASAATTGATLTITRPVGTIADDVMVGSIAVRPTTATITPPPGWTLIRRLDNAAPNANSLAIYFKAAGAAEPASYSFEIAGSTHTTGGIQSFDNVDTVDPIDVESGQNTGNALTHVTPGVTTTVRNTMLVTTHSVASASTWSPPAGMTESFDATTGPSDAVGQTTEGSRVAQAARAAVAGKTATAAANADVGNAHILALKPSLLVAQPAGLLTNDVMIASIGVTPSTAVVTPPAGWTLVRRIDNGAATANSLLVFRKVATGGEPAAYEWSVSGVDYAVGGIQAFFNVDTAAPIDVESGQATASSLNHAAPSVTTTVPNSMLVTSHTYASSRTWTFPAGMTESFDRPSGANNAIGQSIEGNRLFIAAAGVTGARTAAAGSDADAGNTHTLALKSARPVITITLPPGTVANDVMIASISVQPSTTVVTAPAGWTLVRTITNATATTNSLHVYQRVAGASEPASYTWTATGLTYGAGGIQSFSGVDTTTPIDVENGALTASALTHATPTVTTTVANTMVVTSHAFASSATWTPPAGMTEAFDAAALAAPDTNGQSIEGSYVLQAASGPTGVKTANASNNADRGNAHILALRPGPIVSTPGSFNAYDSGTAAGAISGFIKTRIAGAAVSLDIVALNAAKTAIFTTFTGAVRVEVLDTSNNGGALDANGCRPTWTVMQTLPDPSFLAADNGRKTVTFTQANAFRDVRLRIRYPAGAPTVTACSTDNFAIRPSAFAAFSTSDANSLTAGTARSLNDITLTRPPPFAGGVVHKAGRPFSVRAEAHNSAGAITTNYVGIPTATLASCAPVGPACTAGVGTLTLVTSFAAGQLASDTASYDNVGSFQLQLVDSTFSAVDSADGSTAAERNITSAAINVGRFVPDHFAVSFNTPVFAPGCAGPTSAFTYVGQPFNYTTAPVITVTAQDAANNTTNFYAGSWWRITNASLTSRSYSPAVTLDTTGLPLTSVDPAVATTTPGNGTLTFSSGAGLSFSRTALTAPFNAEISLAINVIDLDDVSYAGNPATVGASTPGNGLTFDDGNVATTNDKQMLFGRLRLSNANGSQLISMPIRIETQYWNGSAFRTSADSCTSISTANIALGNYQGNLSAGETAPAAITSFSSGIAWLRLSAPGSANNGSVDISVNLTGGAAGASCTPGMPASTGSGRSYLQSTWGCGATHNNDPTARATFGVYRNADQMIYQRENF